MQLFKAKKKEEADTQQKRITLTFFDQYVFLGGIPMASIEIGPYIDTPTVLRYTLSANVVPLKINFIFV